MKHPVLSLSTASSVFLAALVSGTVASAQDEDTEPVVLDVIVVTPTGLPTEVLYSPASVTIVDSEEISEIPPSSVANLLSDVPGVQVKEDGIERIRIRGEDSQRVAILIDGQRISDHNRYGTPILISPTEIDRIEIVRGPSSVVSGNRAIGGVVNIITKRGADKPIEVTATTGYLGANDGYRAAGSVAGTLNNFDYRLSYSKSELNDRKTPDGTLSPSSSNDQDIHAFLGYRFNEHNYVGFRAQDYDISAKVYTGDPDFIVDLPKRDLTKYSVFYEGKDLTSWMSMLKVSAYTQKIDRLFENDITVRPNPFVTTNVVATSDDEQTTSGFLASANLEFFSGHRTVIGLEYEDDRLDTDKDTTSTTTTGGPFPIISTTETLADASIKTASVFAQHEVTYGDLTGTFGARYYNVNSEIDSFTVNGASQPLNSNSDGRWLGSAGLVYALPHDIVLRGNISQGYTYPSLSELYLTTSAGGTTINGNPDLEPETATNYEIGLRVDRSIVTLDAAIFYTEAKNYITTAADPSNPGQLIYSNVNNVDSWGFEVAAEFDPGWHGIRPYVILSNVTREFKYSNGFSTKNSGTPEWIGTLGVRSDWELFDLTGTWDVFMRGESAAKLVDEDGNLVDSGSPTGLNPTSGWATLNFRGSVDLTEHASLNLEVDNILNQSYRASDQIEAAGTNVSLFLTAKF
ncbi:MAG: TonB-dependent receptor [Pseudomonadota bacterium]